MKKSSIILVIIISAINCFAQDSLDPTGYYTSRRKLKTNNGSADDELNSRTFFKNLDLYNSPSRYLAQNYYQYSIVLLLPMDERKSYIGEQVASKIKVEPYVDFWNKPTMQEIHSKMVSDFANYNTPLIDKDNIDAKTVIIIPKVEVFYIAVRGAPLWRRSYAKVRLSMLVKQNEAELINQKYESVYNTNGNDEDWEGIPNESIESGGNVAIGTCLRQTLDKFYKDLDSKLNTIK